MPTEEEIEALIEDLKKDAYSKHKVEAPTEAPPVKVRATETSIVEADLVEDVAEVEETLRRSRMVQNRLDRIIKKID